MAWIYLAGSAGSPSVCTNTSGLSHTASRTNSVNRSLSKTCAQDDCQKRPCGTTCELSRPMLSWIEWISSPQAGHARIFLSAALAVAWTEAEADLFLKSSDAFATCDHNSSSWKTHQLSLFGELTEYCWDSMRFGMMRAGQLFQPQKWAPRTFAKDFSYLLPTPTASEYGTGGNGVKKGKQKPVLSLNHMARHNLWPTPRASDGDKGSSTQLLGGKPSLAAKAAAGESGKLNPEFVEWLQGFPVGWTVLNHSEILSCHRRRRKRLKGYCSDSEAGEK